MIQFFLATQSDRIRSTDSLWTQAIPLDREGLAATDADRSETTVRYGEYFEAVQAFLQTDGYKVLIKAVNQNAPKPIKPNQIEKIDVFLIKHGAFYHPARVTIFASRRQYDLVLNVALSTAGRHQIANEFNTLQTLSRTHPFAFIPQVYSLGTGGTAQGLKCPMFLGEWLDGFHEFHHAPPSSGSLDPMQVVVWDPEAGNVILTSEQTASLYRQASMILASFFSPETYQIVFPWHHAAGDFVVRIAHQRVEVKLIAVRAYVPFCQTPSERMDAETRSAALMEVMLNFMIHLTLRMRLDRLNGIGEISWLDQHYMAPIVKGCFQGLDLMRRMYAMPKGFIPLLQQYLHAQSESVWREAAEACLQAYPGDTPEAPVIRQQIEAHISSLCKALQG